MDLSSRPLALAALLALCACTEAPSITQSDLELKVGGAKLADVHEVVRATALGGEQVQQLQTRVDAPNDTVLALATLDPQGFATSASYRREGKKGKRYVELKGEGAARVLFSRGDDETLALPELPVVLWSLQHRVKAAPQKEGAPPAAREVLLLDLDNASFVRATLDAAGHLTPRPPPPLTQADAPRADQRAPAPFLESATPKVASFCKAQAAGDGAREAARRVALAVKPKLSPERGGGPPSALMAVQLGGADQAGAALTAACLRSVGHAARVVSGLVGGAPRSWAQVYLEDARSWLDVDPLDVDLEGKQALEHRAQVEGFPGPLTTALLGAPPSAGADAGP